MSLGIEIALGTTMLVLCAVTQVVAVAIAATILSKRGRSIVGNRRVAVSIGFLLFGLLAMVAAHTVQIWLWAAALLLFGALPDFEAAFYFSTVTYTTLGYGDITLAEGYRLFATFAAISGLVAFGITSAFLVALIVRILPRFGGPRS